MFLFRSRREQRNTRVGIEPRHLNSVTSSSSSSSTLHQTSWTTRQYFTLDDYQHHDSSTSTNKPTKKHFRLEGKATSSGLLSRLFSPFHCFGGQTFQKLHDHDGSDNFKTRTRPRRKRQGRSRSRRHRVSPLLYSSDDNQSMNAELTNDCNIQVYNMAFLCAGDDEPPVHIASSPREYGMCPLGHQELVYFKL